MASRLPSSHESADSPTWSPDFVLITSQPLEPYNAQQLVADDRAGGICTFLGVTRDSFEGRRVLRLEYECYQPMAVKLMHQLCAEMRQMWSLVNVAVLHRIGPVATGSASVLVAASSAHRRDCLEAVSWCIDEIKRRLPIWKKEVYEDGSAWKQNSDYDMPALSKQTTDVIVQQWQAQPDDGQQH